MISASITYLPLFMAAIKPWSLPLVCKNQDPLGAFFAQAFKSAHLAFLLEPGYRNSQEHINSAHTHVHTRTHTHTHTYTYTHTHTHTHVHAYHC